MPSNDNSSALQARWSPFRILGVCQSTRSQRLTKKTKWQKPDVKNIACLSWKRTRGKKKKKNLQSALCSSTITAVMIGFAVNKPHWSSSNHFLLVTFSSAHSDVCHPARQIWGRKLRRRDYDESLTFVVFFMRVSVVWLVKKVHKIRRIWKSIAGVRIQVGNSTKGNGW